MTTSYCLVWWIPAGIRQPGGISHGSVLDGALHEGASFGVTANLTGAEDIIAHHDGLGKEWGRGGGIG